MTAATRSRRVVGQTIVEAIFRSSVRTAAIKRPDDPDLDDDVIEALKRPREQEKTLSFSLAIFVYDVSTIKYRNCPDARS